MIKVIIIEEWDVMRKYERKAHQRSEEGFLEEVTLFPKPTNRNKNISKKCPGKLL